MCIHAVVTRSRSISTIEPLTEDVSHRGASLNCPTQVMYMLQSTFFFGEPTRCRGCHDYWSYSVVNI